MNMIKFLKEWRVLVLSIVLIISITLVFSACKGEESITESEESTETSVEETENSNTEETVTLTLWDWHSGEIPDVVKPLYAQFEEEYNVNLVVSDVSFSDLPKKYLLASEANAYPDLGELWAANLVPILAEKKGLEPLDSYIEKEGGDEFIGNLREEFLTSYKGSYYSLPIYAGNSILFYNKTMFDEAGIEDVPKTWDELIDVAVKLTDPTNGQYGLALNGADSEILFQLTPFIAQNGAQVGRVDGEIMINSKETVEAIQFVVDLINKYEVIPSFTTYGYQQARESFMSGKVGMIIDGPWTIPLVESKEPEFEWLTATLPMGKVDGASISIGDTEFGMFSTSENKELCWEFIKFMTSEETNYKWIKGAPNLPAVKSVFEKDDIKNDLYLKPCLDQLELGNVIDQYRQLPPQLESALDKFKIEMQAAALGEKTVQDAMDVVAAEWDALYKEWEEDYGEYTR